MTTQLTEKEIEKLKSIKTVSGADTDIREGWYQEIIDKINEIIERLKTP